MRSGCLSSSETAEGQGKRDSIGADARWNLASSHSSLLPVGAHALTTTTRASPRCPPGGSLKFRINACPTQSRSHCPPRTSGATTSSRRVPHERRRARRADQALRARAQDGRAFRRLRGGRPRCGQSRQKPPRVAWSLPGRRSRVASGTPPRLAHQDSTVPGTQDLRDLRLLASALAAEGPGARLGLRCLHEGARERRLPRSFGDRQDACGDRDRPRGGLRGRQSQVHHGRHALGRSSWPRPTTTVCRATSRAGGVPTS